MTKDLPQFGKDELNVLINQLELVLTSDVKGDLVELGCYKGETSVQIAKILKKNKSEKHLYLYDGFAGLPEKTLLDQSPAGMQFVAGELLASKKEVSKLLTKTGYRNFTVKKSWFSELEPKDLPQQICLAFLDGDYYESIKDSLRLVWPKLTENSLVIVDDYQNQSLPGAARAVDEWLTTHNAKLLVQSSLAIIKPRL